MHDFAMMPAISAMTSMMHSKIQSTEELMKNTGGPPMGIFAKITNKRPKAWSGSVTMCSCAYGLSMCQIGAMVAAAR